MKDKLRHNTQRDELSWERQWEGEQTWTRLKDNREREKKGVDQKEKPGGVQESWEDLSALVGFDFNGSQRSPTSNPFGPNSTAAFQTF